MTQDFNSLFGQQPQASAPQTPTAPAPALAAPQNVASFIASTTEDDIGYDKSLYFEPGYYRRCELLSILLKQVELRTIFIAEFLILESEVRSRPPGTQVAVVRPIEGKYAKSTAGECRKHMAAVIGISWDQLTEHAIKMLTDPTHQPAAGRLVEVNATLNKKGTFTNVQMNAVPGSMEEHRAEAARLRQAFQSQIPPGVHPGLNPSDGVPL